MRERFGPALSGNYVSDDGQWAVQVFAGDTLYTPMSDQSGCLLLSQTDPNAPEYGVIWKETYKVCGAAFDPRTRKASVRDPWTNETSRVPGGATFRFALAIDCGKCWPNGFPSTGCAAGMPRVPTKSACAGWPRWA